MAVNCSCTEHACCKKNKKKEKLYKVDILNSYCTSYTTRTYCKEIIELYESKGYKLEIVKEISDDSKE